MHNKELLNCYSSSDTSKMVQLRRMRFVGHEVHMGERKILIKKLNSIWKTQA
jgi:hypothetical protein